MTRLVRLEAPRGQPPARHLGRSSEPPPLCTCGDGPGGSRVIVGVGVDRHQGKWMIRQAPFCRSDRILIAVARKLPGALGVNVGPKPSRR
jgi:hypothetical protein